jgi:hypothetical protein
MTGICLSVAAQNPETQSEVKGLPPRASAAEFQAQTQAGNITLAAEFTGHSVPTAQGPLTSDDYIIVEVGLYGPPDTRIKLSSGDFSLRVNGRKDVLPAQAFGWVLPSLKDPEWISPEQEAKAKTKLSGGGEGKNSNDPPPPPPKIPVPVQRAMAQRVQRAALPEGDRPLPLAGLLFFQYRGKAEGIRALELIYSGPSGRTTLALPH